MNLYSRSGSRSRWSWWAGAVLAALLGGACGGASGGGPAAGKSDWEKRHGAAVRAVSVDLDSAREGLAKGDRPAIISSCNQLKEDLVDARKGLPVPDPTVDGAVRRAFDAIEAGVPDCLEGARVASQASITESAIAKFRDARPAMDDANAAIAAWK